MGRGPRISGNAKLDLASGDEGKSGLLPNHANPPPPPHTHYSRYQDQTYESPFPENKHLTLGQSAQKRDRSKARHARGGESPP